MVAPCSMAAACCAAYVSTWASATPTVSFHASLRSDTGSQLQSPSWACGVEHAVGGWVSQKAVPWIAQHKVAIGIGLGILSIATGYGALLIAGGAIQAGLGTTVAISAVSFASGTVAATLDGRDCYENLGINGQCLATMLGGIGLLMSVPGALVGAALISEPPFQELLALATGGFFLSYGAVATDAIAAAIRAWRNGNAKSGSEGCAQT
jgi:hypothetical protein